MQIIRKVRGFVDHDSLMGRYHNEDTLDAVKNYVKIGEKYVLKIPSSTEKILATECTYKLTLILLNLPADLHWAIWMITQLRHIKSSGFTFAGFFCSIIKPCANLPATFSVLNSSIHSILWICSLFVTCNYCGIMSDYSVELTSCLARL